MKKLSEISQNDFVKLLVYGDSGTGKTCFAAGAEGPIEYWDFDNKISSAAKFYSHEPERLAQIDVLEVAQYAPMARIPEFEARMRILDKIITLKQPLHFKTLVIDSLTTLTHYVLQDYMIRSQTGMKRALDGIPAMQDYQLLNMHLKKMVMGLLALPCNVVFLGHMHAEKDEVSGALNREVLMAGKFAAELPIYFEEVYVSRVNAKGEYVLQTQTDNMFKCRSQRKLPKEIPAKWSALGVKC